MADEWQREVAEVVRRSLDATDFVALLEQLPGVDPSAATAALKCEAVAGDERAKRLLFAGQPVEMTPSSRPIPHPLDFDWRFTPATNGFLLAIIGDVVPAGATVGYFGAPTTWQEAALLGDRRHILFDRRAGRYESGEALAIDLLRDPLPPHLLHAAVVDPPWYPEHQEAFLTAAASVLREDGLLLASFPPRLTRPGVLAERTTIIANAVRAGIILVDEAPLQLRYQTPPFETAAFAEAGVCTPAAWRRGDMLTFQKNSHAEGQFARRATTYGRRSQDFGASDLQGETDAPNWTFIDCDEIPLAVRAQALPHGDVLLAPAVPGATLATVSRRHPARSRAALWSSLNRIYVSSSPATLAAIVRAIAEDLDVVAAAGVDGSLPKEHIRATADDIRKLVQREREEHGLQ